MQCTTTDQLIELRDQTRAIAESEYPRLCDVVRALISIARPDALLGDDIFGGKRLPSKRQKEAAAEFLDQLKKIAGDKPFHEGATIAPPFDISSTSIEFHQWQYSYPVAMGEITKTVKVLSPFKWVVSFAETGPPALRDAIAKGTGTTRLAVHNLALNMAVMRNETLRRILGDLRLSVETVNSSEFGSLPLTCIGLALPAQRPPDELILKMTRLSGRDDTEELVDLDYLNAVRDPFLERVQQRLKSVAI